MFAVQCELQGTWNRSNAMEFAVRTADDTIPAYRTLINQAGRRLPAPDRSHHHGIKRLQESRRDHSLVGRIRSGRYTGRQRERF
jgi:hypothetical protein